MLTEFGKLLRIIRINSGDSSREMARKLGFSPSYLSAIESGKRNIPTDMEKLLSKSYPLSQIDLEKLRTAMFASSDTVKINLTDFAEKKQRVIMAIAQDDISDNVLDEISDLIFRHGKDTEDE
ncbi:MAG: helix-turn-helix transcriptional regulator [Eubacteriales bacterium]|jgi:transcriptional regulator with XRE-family HTH domain|nr:XRE family transcriptional regulator [Clostridiales bacterium]